MATENSYTHAQRTLQGLGLSDKELLLLAEQCIRRALSMGLSFPLDLEQEHIQHASMQLTTALRNSNTLPMGKRA